jgi:formylglycine-generating enzyme required for sulfatase activity
MHDRLERLRRKLAITEDPDDRADLEAAITALGEKLGVQAAPTGDTITVGNLTQATGVAVGAGARATVYIDGRRGKTSTELLAQYLAYVRGRYAALQLQGVYEKRSAEDVLQISLEQVYTQLATETQVEREHYSGAALESFDAQAYCVQHSGDDVLPSQRRWLRMLPRETDGVVPTGENPSPYTWLDVTTCTGDELAWYTRDLDPIKFFGPQLVTEAITEYSRLVLLGEPGSGKSTALRFLALTLARAGMDASIDLSKLLEGWGAFGNQGRFLPLLLPLLPFAKMLAGNPDNVGAADDVWNYIAGQLETGGRFVGLAAAVHEELLAGRVLLMLDGLDEVASNTSRQQVSAAMQAFATEYPQCRFVVSCRVRAYQGAQNQGWHLPGWSIATLSDWLPAQMVHFVTAWYTAVALGGGVPEMQCNDRAEALRKAILARDDLRRLGVRPLLMTMMALVHLNDGRLPNDRVRLYSRCMTLLLVQWEMAGREASAYGTLMDYVGLPNTGVDTLLPLLEDIAFRTHSAGMPGHPASMNRAELHELVCDTLEKLKHTNPHYGAKRFLEYTDMRAGLLQAGAAGDAYGFPHQTFQEYLAGRKLVGGVGVVQRIMAHRHDDRWHIPILLGVADHAVENRLELPAHLLRTLISARGKSIDEHQGDLLLAAEIGAEVGWDRLERGDLSFSDLREDLARALVTVVEGTTLPASDRIRAGIFLGQLGDPRPGVCSLPPAMNVIDGGSFLMGNTPDEYEAILVGAEDEETRSFFERFFKNTINDQIINVGGFEIARYLVTNAQYALFIKDNGYNLDQPWWDANGRAWLTHAEQTSSHTTQRQIRRHTHHPEWWDDETLGINRPNHPVVGVSWFEAMAFCRWLTLSQKYNSEGYVYRLPTEAEYEFAVRGSARHVYPWGNAPLDGERANYAGLYGSTSAVGCFTRGNSPAGVCELVGNAWIWTGNVYEPYPYQHIEYRETITYPEILSIPARAGGWINPAYNLHGTSRFPASAHLCDERGGFRLARDLKR